MKKLFSLLSLVVACGLFASCTMMGFADSKPKVLIIGDSVSLGYTPHVIEIIGDRVDVQHNKEPNNAGATGRGLENIESWIGDEKWDVIHFNWGLWDICHRKGGKRDLSGKISVELPVFEKNLDTLVMKMKELAPDATLIWAPITYIQGGWGRVKGDEITYNNAAARIMKKHGVTINDIHAQTAKFPIELFKSVGNVHFSQEGYKKIGEQVASTIEDTIAKRAKSSSCCGTCTK